MRRISSHLLLTPQGLLPGRVVSVSDEGVITDIAEVGGAKNGVAGAGDRMREAGTGAVSAAGNLDREAGVEFYSGILVPGFVNAHCHLELSHLWGAIPTGRGFAAFVEGMKTASREDLQGAAKFWDARMWSEGVAAVGDICNGTSTFELKRRSNIRYHSFIEIFGAEADSVHASALREKASAKGLAASITPHSLYSLSPEKFAEAVGGGNRVSENRPLSIHFMESDFEVASPGAASPAEQLVACVPSDRPVVLVHNCRVTQRDIDIVMGHFSTPVTWVLCPGSNRYISGLVPPVELLRKNRLHIAVGTDSLASNDTLSVIKELCLLAFLTDAPLEEILTWATACGAKALGMDDTLGTMEVGRSPGLVLLTGIDFGKMKLTENSGSRRIV